MEALLARPYVPRSRTLYAEKFTGEELVKVVTGPRRAGKSIFSLHFLKDAAPAYANFDDERLIKLTDYDELINELHACYGSKKQLLLDEIQNLPGWELFVNRLQRQGYNITLTGSNSRLLSGELATSLTGRHVPIEILPFSFREVLTAEKEETVKDLSSEARGRILALLEQYLVNGGFPEVVVKKLEPKGYLDTLMDSLILRDVVKRYSVRLSGKIYDLHGYLLNNFSAECSFRKLAGRLGFKSVTTLEKYVGYLEEAYLVYVLQRYSHKAAERLGTSKKVYLVDNGYVAAAGVQFSPDRGRLMENLVFSELLKAGREPNKDLFYYKTRNGRGVDFITRKGTRVDSLIQVAYGLDMPGTKEREVKALIEAGDELRCGNLAVITWDHEETVKTRGQEINFIPLWKWLVSI
jgi:predicted AAA+ superfamily ATPase